MDDVTNDLRGVAGQASDDVDAKLNDIKESLATLRETVADLISKGSSIASSQLSSTMSAAKEKADIWAKSGKEFASQTYDRAKEKEADLEEVIQLHPVISVGAGIAIGFLLGALTVGTTKK